MLGFPPGKGFDEMTTEELDEIEDDIDEEEERIFEEYRSVANQNTVVLLTSSPCNQ